MTLQECCRSHCISILYFPRQEERDFNEHYSGEESRDESALCYAQLQEFIEEKLWCNIAVLELCGRLSSLLGVCFANSWRSLEENPTRFLLAVKIITIYQMRQRPLVSFFQSLPFRRLNGNILQEIRGSANTLDMFGHVGHSVEDLTSLRSCLKAWQQHPKMAECHFDHELTPKFQLKM